MTIKGAKAHTDRLKRMQARTPQEVVRALYAAGQEIEIEAEISITNGSISGKGHVPSLPGEPPNADTRVLDSNIETTVAANLVPTVHVTSNAPYSAALEYGTSKMAERPFMRPAVAKKRADVVRLVGAAVSLTTR
jgi:HK97 gp10 family phage protein